VPTVTQWVHVPQRPKTESLHSAYTALGDPHVRVAERNLPTHFVSHCWGCPFASLANALFVHQLGDDVAWAALEETVDLDKLQTLVEKELPSTTENFYCTYSTSARTFFAVRG
jgi:hypothetical protein